MRVAPDGYLLQKLLSSTPHSEVWQAARDAEPREVLLKLYLSGPRQDPGSRAARELEILRRIEMPGIPRALALDRSTEHPILVLERVPGVTLASQLAHGPLAVDAWLALAIELTDLVARIHEKRVLHKELTPENVRVERGTGKVWIVDFSFASELGAAELSGPDASLEGTLAYIAPEQTGRMNRGCDARSDLYTLGATLYHALTGRPPFEEQDPLELIHAHIARLPGAPHELRPELSRVLSDMLQKLLRKQPEERYQSARGLHADLLECREQLASSGRIIGGFALGAAEVPDRPRFSRTLYGREREIEALHDVLARAAAGSAQTLWIGGEAGMGKSALVDELRPELAQRGGYLALAGFDAYRDVPYAGWAAALESLVQQILLESDVRLARWRRELGEGLGNIGQALIDLVPDLRFVLGEVPPAPKLGPRETHARLSLALQRFVRACATADHPLVLFLDNLEAIDAASRALLEELVCSGQPAALLVIGAYRPEPAGGERSIAALLERLSARGIPFERIELVPLTGEATAAMLADALGRPREQVSGLAECIARKTDRSPLLIQQFVSHLHTQGLIRFEHPQGWSWRDSAIAAADIPEGAVSMMVAKLERLERAALDVVQFASCVGDEFDAEMLTELSERPRETLDAALFALVEEGLIAPSRGGFRFVHNRIREAAQGLLSEQARSRIHHETAQLLLARIPEAERSARVFEIVEHLNRARTLLADDQCIVAAELNLDAGNHALASGAVESAAGYFGVARGLLRETDWEQHARLGFDLHLQSADCALRTGDFATALALLDVLERRELELMDATRVTAKRIQVFTLTLHPEECARYVLAVLRRLGVRWPLRPSPLRARLALRGTQWRMRMRRHRWDLFRPATKADPRRLAPLMILGVGAGITARVDLHLGVLASCWALTSNLKHGYLARPGYTLAVYASFLELVLNDSDSAQRGTELALSLSKNVPDPLYSPRTEMQVHGLARPWWMRRRQAIAPLDAISESMKEVGDLEYADYARFLKIVFRALAGDPVASIDRLLGDMAESVRRSRHRYPEQERCHQVFRYLAERPSTPDWTVVVAESDAWIRANHGSAESYIRTLWLLVLCVYGQHELAFRQSEQMGERLFKVAPYVQIADHTFYRGLAAAALAGTERGMRRRRHARELRRSAKRLRLWARSGPDFVHMAIFLEAERACLRGDLQRARHLYRDAAQRARSQEFPHHAALANERLALSFEAERRERDAAVALRDAVALYQAWGALAKAEELNARREALDGSELR